MTKKSITNITSLKTALNDGESLKYVYFWGHSANLSYIDHHCLSQWYPCGFTQDNILYPTTEHYLMAKKALLFNDKDAFKLILQSSNPGAVKKIGRAVIGFEQTLWDKNKFDIAVSGNYLKFFQNDDLKNYLINTRNKVLVEASPVDRIWGVGLAQDDPKINDPENWQGDNLLGFALMQVRAEIRKS
tara:strand:+ start:33556 stop:34116 length:561 start_codon:yes stop_codon:yes gene_type:complete